MKKTFHPQLILLWLLGIAAMTAQKIEGLGVIHAISVIVWLTDFIYLTLTVKTKRQLLVTGICFWIGSVIRTFGFMGIFAADVLLVTVYSIPFFGALILNRFLAKRWKSFLTTLTVPALWALMFLILSLIRIPSIIRFDFLWFDCKSLVQSVSYLSTTGFNFVTVWVAAVLAQGAANRKIILPAAAVLLGIVLIVAGRIQLAQKPEPCGTVRIGYSTGAYTGDFLDNHPISYEECVASFRKVFNQAAAQNLDMLAFCEETYEIQDYQEKEFVEIIEKAAKESGIYVLIGFDVKDTDNSEGGKALNKIILIGNDGNAVSEYAKYNVIPILEDAYKPGDGTIPAPVIDINGTAVKVAFAICYDSNFSHYIGKIPEDTQLFILPSWDWDGITYMHSRLCGNLAIENRVSLLKPTYDGYTIAVDPYGNILDFKSTKETGYENVQVIEMPIFEK